MNPQYQSVVPPVPTARKTQGFSRKTIVLFSGLGLALIAAVSLLIMTASGKPVEQMQRLSVRLENLQAIVEQGNKNVQGVELSKIQSEISILLAGDIVAVSDALKAAGLGKIPSDIKSLESDEATLKTLSDAQLDGSFDGAYKKAIAQKLESTMALMRELNGKTNDRKLKATLSTAYDHSSLILNQLASL